MLKKNKRQNFENCKNFFKRMAILTFGKCLTKLGPPGQRNLFKFLKFLKFLKLFRRTAIFEIFEIAKILGIPGQRNFFKISKDFLRIFNSLKI